MTDAASWRRKASFIALVSFGIEVLTYIVERSLYKILFNKYLLALLVTPLVGMFLSLVVLVLALVGSRKIFKVMLALGSLAFAYLWYCDLAWLAMVK